MFFLYYVIIFFSESAVHWCAPYCKSVHSLHARTPVEALMPTDARTHAQSPSKVLLQKNAERTTRAKQRTSSIYPITETNIYIFASIVVAVSFKDVAGLLIIDRA